MGECDLAPSAQQTNCVRTPQTSSRAIRTRFGPGIEVFLSMRLEDDNWVEWFAWAINRLDGNGLTIEREVSLEIPDGRPEVNRGASTELEELIVPDGAKVALTDRRDGSSA